MKIEKLELKHICGYLPWGLTGCHKEGHICNIDFDMVVKYGTNLANYKPLLFPLSALTEPLEDGTVPAIEIAKLCDNGHNNSVSKIKTYTGLMIVSTDICDDVENITIRTNNVISVEIGGRYVTMTTAQRIFEYLYSKHFWLYDQTAFERGIVIDKRTVKL